MDREETRKILAVLKAGYPNFYKDLKKTDADQIIDLWATMFADEPAAVVVEAVKSLMCTLKYPPTIADVKERISMIIHPQEMTEMEAWNKVRNAISYYNAKENFDRLPPILQKVVGNSEQLRIWAQMDSETVDSVIQSNFMRSYKVKAAQEKELSVLPESTKQIIQQLAGTKRMELTDGCD